MHHRCLSLLFVFLTFSVACDRSAPEPQAAGEQSVAPSISRPSPGLKKLPKSSGSSDHDVEKSSSYRFPQAKRLVAIGDLHGDFLATKRAFALAGAADSSGKWVGGRLVVVQTGDQLDRGDGERKILDFLARLQKEAKVAGGSLHVLNGNHESMNVMGDFRYVTPAAMTAFSDYLPASPLASQVRPEYRSRAAAFLPGGGAARLLAQRPIIVMVGKTVFVHGGVLPAHVEYGIDRLNRESKAWMMGERAQAPSLLMDPEGPIWTRLYSLPDLPDDACRVLAEALGKMGASRMVVGHTVQERGLSSACNERVFRIDVGLASYYGDRAVQVLEIKGGQAKVLSEEPVH